MNIFKGLNHQVRIFTNDNGPLKTRKRKKPEGMSGRQWKKLRKALRGKVA